MCLRREGEAEKAKGTGVGSLRGRRTHKLGSHDEPESTYRPSCMDTVKSAHPVVQVRSSRRELKRRLISGHGTEPRMPYSAHRRREGPGPGPEALTWR